MYAIVIRCQNCARTISRLTVPSTKVSTEVNGVRVDNDDRDVQITVMSSLCDECGKEAFEERYMMAAA